MKKKTVWLILSHLVVVALVLASCTPVAVEKEEEVVTPEEEAAPPVEEELGLEYIDSSTIFEEKPSYPDGRAYARTSDIKTYYPTGPSTVSYLRDGLAYLRNEGESGFI